MPVPRWENTVSAETLDKFKADYADRAYTIGAIGTRFHLDDSSVSAIARRIGLKPRHVSKTRASAIKTIPDLIEEERILTHQLAAVKELRARAEVKVILTQADIVEIGGLLLDGEVLGTDLDQLKLFVRGGGLAKIRDLVGSGV